MIKTIGIIGMGALGLLYAEQLVTGLKDEAAVSFVMDKNRAERHQNDVYSINGKEKHFKVINSDTAKPFDLVIVGVKYNSLPEALETMKNCVGDSTIIMSVMNGVTSEKIIGERYGMDKLIYTVAQGMDAMRDNTSLRYTQCGKLHIGGTDAAMRERVKEVEELFIRAEVPYVLEENIMYRMWFKFMLNVGINQTCMVFDTDYKTATTSGEVAYEKMVGAMREVIAIAPHEGVTLTEEDLNHCLEIERTLDPHGYPSMEQDRKAKRKSEVDMFAGEVIRKAKQYNTPYEYNEFFYNEVEKIEAQY